VISEVSNIMFGQFIKNFQTQLQQPVDAVEAEAKPINAASLAWAAAKGAFRRES
jgi:chemotaxis protein CheY-P-specific phosphatase CheC